MRTLPNELTMHTSSDLAAMSAAALYRIARLRQEVFVVEQHCVYLDLDGRDAEAGTTLLWAEDAAGDVAATMRVLREDALEPGLSSIGRVATAPAWRGRGVAAVLLDAAIQSCDGDPILIHAQSYLTDWYGRFGFRASGPEFVEDGIPHTPMRIG
ncbi:ElaA protein [Leucobacter luti]|uniref:GNAT family N-acetyltransferase n=1 Tax=Leucobacter luti TaxID=340320 RepID=UPI00104F0967|nr:GNAT family N-acetyltransferase [Leucobacter luti]MCW2289452.1 ElaA protein [Leucobacter luti]TCK40011.1 ElaA protein [Leucobacter luti]